MNRFQKSLVAGVAAVAVVGSGALAHGSGGYHQGKGPGSGGMMGPGQGMMGPGQGMMGPGQGMMGPGQGMMGPGQGMQLTPLGPAADRPRPGLRADRRYHRREIERVRRLGLLLLLAGLPRTLRGQSRGLPRREPSPTTCSSGEEPWLRRTSLWA
jgi:hypothetical protein